MANTEEQLKDLLDKATTDNTQLRLLLDVYTDLIASSDRQWIERYRKPVSDVLMAWKGKYKTAEALYHVVEGFSNYFLTKPQEALTEFERALDYCSDSSLFNDIKGMAYMGLGSAYRNLGNIDKSMANISLALEMIDENGPTQDWHVYTYRMLGEVHVFIGEYEQAEEYFIKAEQVMEAVDKPTPRFRVYIGLGACYIKMGQEDKSRLYLNKALEVKGISQAEKARGLCDLGVLYLDQPDKALAYFEQSCTIRKQGQLEDAYTTSLLYKGECLLEMGDLDKAYEVLLEAQELANTYNVPVKKLHLLRLMRDFYKKQGNDAVAIDYFQQFYDLQKTLNARQVKNIFQLKNKQIATQHKEIKEKHTQLKNTLNELARIKVSRRALFFSIITVVVLVIATELFLDPLIEKYSYNSYLGLAAKVLIAFLLKPIDSMYERLLFRKAVRG
ncbi:MAG: tetratricopeptide repeat protein [Cyclobacteriaceae bacterium]|nr:tetratricopeptide repeat protein [Cyclobacteriaceae bacterium]